MFPGWKSRVEPTKAVWGICIMSLQNTQWKKSNLCFCEASGFSSKLHFGWFGRWDKGHLKQQVPQSIPSMLSPSKGFLSVCWPFDWWMDQNNSCLVVVSVTLWLTKVSGRLEYQQLGKQRMGKCECYLFNVLLSRRQTHLWPVYLACLYFCEIVYFFPLERKTCTSCGIPPLILPHVYYIRLMVYENCIASVTAESLYL